MHIMRKFILIIGAALTAAAAYAGQFNIGLEAGYDFAHLRSYYVSIEQNASKMESTSVSHVIYQHSDVIETYDEVEINGHTQKQDKNITPTERLPQMHGFHVGPTFDWRSTKIPSLGLRFGAQFVFLATGGLIFDTKQDRDVRDEMNKQFESVSFVTQMYRLQLPLRLSYTFNLKKGMELWLMTGPKFNIGIAMVTDQNTYSASKNVDMKVHTDYYSGKVTITDHGEKANSYDLEWYDKYIPFDMSWGFGIGYSYKNFGICAVYDLGISDMGGYQKASNTALKLDYKALTYINQLQVVLSYTFNAKKK